MNYNCVQLLNAEATAIRQGRMVEFCVIVRFEMGDSCLGFSIEVDVVQRRRLRAGTASG